MTPQTSRRVATRAQGDRRAEILAIAGRIIAEKGFANATVRDIADAAGILSGSLYHHFESKEAILEELLRGYLGSLVERYEAAVAEGGDPREVLGRLIDIGFEAVAQHKIEITILHNNHEFLARHPAFAFSGELTDRIMRIWVAVIERGRDAGALTRDVDAAVAYRVMMSGIQSTVRWWKPDGAWSIDQVAEQYRAVYLKGLLAGQSVSRP